MAELSPQEIQRRSEQARKMVAEGKLGGPGRGQGARRKKRVAQLVALEARKHANEISQVLIDAIQPDKPTSVRLKGVEMWLKIERDEAALQLQEERNLETMSTAQLIEEIAGRLTRINEVGALPEELAAVVGEVEIHRPGS